MLPRLTIALVSATLLLGSSANKQTVHAADWLQFRGNDANGVSTEQTVPTSLSADTIAWKQELPGRGLSGPIVTGDRVVVTCSSGYEQDRLHVICFSESSGELLWQRQFWATGRTMCHTKMSVASPTPASDGERIFAFYSSNDLVCLDLDGNLLWYRGLGHDFPNASNSLGMASSPVVIGDTLIVQIECEAESFSAGLDTETGLGKWRIERPRKSNWTSPSILRCQDGETDLAILSGPTGLSAVHPQTGDVVWSYDKGGSSIPSATVVQNAVYTPSQGLTALHTSAGGRNFKVDWNGGNLQPGTPSPLVYQDHTFTVNGAGVVACGDAKTGERVWQMRLKGRFTSTPVAGGGHLFFFNEQGMAYVVRPGPESGEIVSELDFGETILCTPALSDGALYVRSDGHLWKIGG